MERTLSIIICSYNSSQTIKDTLEGVCRQRLPDNVSCDVYVFDDASTDLTVPVAKEIAQELNMSVHFVLRPTNLGLVANLFKAIESLEDTDFVYITAADDFITKDNFLQDAIETLDNQSIASFACAEWSKFEEESGMISMGLGGLALPELISPETWKQLGHPVFLIQSCLFRRSSLPHHFDEWMYRVYPEDWFLLCYAFQSGDAAVFNNMGLQYRCHAGGISKKPLSFDIAHRKYLVNVYIRKYFSDRVRSVIANPVWQAPQIAVLAIYEKRYWKAIVFTLKTLPSLSVSISDKYIMVKTIVKVFFTGYVPRY